jgi:hypothetical protein
MRVFFALALLGAMVAGAWAQSIQLSEPQLIERYNARLARDGQDPIAGCKRSERHQFICTFADDGFRATLTPDDVTGSIGGSQSPTSMIVSLNDNRVDAIYLGGDRARPADLINFTAHLESLLHALGPDETDVRIEQDTLDLGLMRGDHDASIGEEKDVSEQFATIKCVNRPFAVSVGIDCAIKLAAK